MADSIEIRSPIGDVLDWQTQRFPDREAVVHVAAGVRYTYREFRAEIWTRTARGLMSLGIQKGKRSASGPSTWSGGWRISTAKSARPGYRQSSLPAPTKLRYR